MNIDEDGAMSNDMFGGLLKVLNGNGNDKIDWSRSTKRRQTYKAYNPEHMAKHSVPSIQMDDGRLLRRTENALMQMAIERGLRIGTRARIEYRALDRNHDMIQREAVEGTVIGIFPHLFVVQIGSRRECFRWNEWAGDEHVKVRFRK